MGPLEEIRCPECDGVGATWCSSCGAGLGECEVCQGTGLDPDVIDLVRFIADDKARMDISKASRSVWEKRGGEHIEIGRDYGNGVQLLYEDYRKDKVAEKAAGEF